MRYGISPAEKNELAAQIANRTFNAQRDNLPRIPGLSVEERSAQSEVDRDNNNRVYGRMRTRVKPQTGNL